MHTHDMASGNRRGRGWEGPLVALGAAAVANLLLVVVLDEIVIDVDEPVRPPSAARATAGDAPPPLIGGTYAPASASMVGLVTVSPPAMPLDAVLGVGDTTTTGAAPARPDSTDLPGDQAADLGGGGVGGTATWTERRDRADDAALRRRMWNSPDAYRSPRAAGGRRAATTEAITRAPASTYGDRAPAPLALDGAAAASTGDTTGAGSRGLPVVAAATAPDTTAGSDGATTPRRVEGAARANREAAHVDPGERAVDIQRKGPVADDRAVAGASDQRRVDPFDLTPPRSGGTHEGENVAGSIAAPGMLADGWGRGTSASRSPDDDGTGGDPTFATRQDPYFTDLFRRLDRMIEYPRDLRIRMISGRVVALVTLRADGKLGDVTVHAGSGHAAFDDALTGALREIGKLGPVPRALLEGRGELRVMIPYTFRSPMIR
jgi:TonB family protein